MLNKPTNKQKTIKFYRFLEPLLQARAIGLGHVAVADIQHSELWHEKRGVR